MLLCLIAVPFLLSVSFVIKQQVAAYKMQCRLKASSLQTIELSINDIHWIKKGHELLIEGNLFDVKSFTETADKIIVTGLFDKLEDRLVNEYSSLIDEHHNKPSAIQLLVFKTIFTCILNEHLSINTEIQKQFSFTVYPRFEEKKLDQLNTIFTPPPEL